MRTGCRMTRMYRHRAFITQDQTKGTLMTIHKSTAVLVRVSHTTLCRCCVH